MHALAGLCNSAAWLWSLPPACRLLVEHSRDSGNPLRSRFLLLPARGEERTTAWVFTLCDLLSGLGRPVRAPLSECWSREGKRLQAWGCICMVNWFRQGLGAASRLASAMHVFSTCLTSEVNPRSQFWANHQCLHLLGRAAVFPSQWRHLRRSALAGATRYTMGLPGRLSHRKVVQAWASQVGSPGHAPQSE